MGQHKILKTEEREMYFIFFSVWQKNYQTENGLRATFAKLEDGSIVEYTEMSKNEKPSGNADDQILLGKGYFHHIGRTQKCNPEVISPEVKEVTISDKKFHPPKIHSSLSQIEKFKPKSSKNIFKKRPYGYF